MKNNLRIFLLSAAAVLGGCDFLDPLPMGNVTDENISGYPSYVRGFVEKAYDLLPSTYISNEYIYLDAITEDAVITSSGSAIRRYGTGGGLSGLLSFRCILDKGLHCHYVREHFSGGQSGAQHPLPCR